MNEFSYESGEFTRSVKQLTGGFIRTGPEGDPRRNHAVRVARVGDLGDVGVVREHVLAAHVAAVREGLLSLCQFGFNNIFS